MQVSVESGEGLTKRLSVHLPAEQVNQLINQKMREAAREVRLDGFRPGKVPLRVIKQRFGHQIRQDAYGELIQTTFYEATVQAEVAPAGEPAIELKENEDGSLTYIASFEVMPEVEALEYSHIQVQKPVVEVSEDDIDRMIDKLRQQRVQWQAVEREAQDGDRITVDFVGTIDGEAFEGGSAEGIPVVIGSGQMIPGFEEGLRGLKAGDETTIEVNFPEDYQAEHLAGKPAQFQIKVQSVEEPILPAVDEEFIRSLGVEEGTVEALRAEIRQNMEREVKQKIKRLVKEQVMQGLLDTHQDLQVPQSTVKKEAEELKQQAKQDMERAGQASSVDLPVHLFEPQAERRVKLGLIIRSIIAKHGIQVDPERVKAAIEEQASTYEVPQEVIDWYEKNPQAKQAVEDAVLEDQVVEFLMAGAQVEEKPQSFDELVNQPQAQA